VIGMTSAPTLFPPVGERDHVIGPANAPVTLVEYGDYECPYCGAAHPIVKEVRRRMGNAMRFAFRHFPLTRVHPHAERAAEAAEAAGAQGKSKFWQMHDMLYEHQDALDDEYLEIYAATIGLDVERFARELLSGVHAPRVREDFLSGVRSGVNGTPTFFINGRRHEGSYDLETLLLAINSQLSAVGSAQVHR
jgi:protein-disulfide isomerase